MLKFIGDGLLAIFPVAALGGRKPACAAAAAAACEAWTRMAARNAARAADGSPPIRLGIGLHVGELLYGNVGSDLRLDFTAIGPAVNLVCRLERLCKELGHPILASSAFAAALDAPLIPLGRHFLRGLPEPEPVFALPECPLPQPENHGDAEDRSPALGAPAVHSERLHRPPAADGDHG